MRKKSYTKLFLLLLIFFIGCGQIYAEMSKADKKFFKLFTKKKRNLNTIKLKYLKRFFRLIDLTEKDAETIYNYKKQKKYIKDFKEILNLPGMSQYKLIKIKKYFILKPPAMLQQAVDVDEIEAEIAEGAESSSEDAEDFQVLQKYKDNPLDLNKATMDDLQEFPWVTAVDAMKILSYRDKRGGFKSIKELAKVPELDEDVYRKLLPFVKVVTAKEKAKEKKELPLHGKFISRYLLSAPYSEEYYSDYYQWPIGVKNKLILNYGEHFDGGIMIERDAGEVKWNDAQKYYVQIQNFWILNKLILGDYRIYSGQGLVFSPSDPMKGGEIVKPAKQKNKGLRPDLTGTENGYYEGAAMQLQPIKFLKIYGFFSYKKHSASTEDLYTGEKNEGDHLVVTSFDMADSDYRSISDLEKKDKLTRTMFGGKIDYNINEFTRIGIVYQHSKFDLPFKKDVRNDYYYKFRGDNISQAGADFDIIYKGMNIFGEVAVSLFPKIPNPITYDPYKDNITDTDKSFGIVIGDIIDLKEAKLVFLYRRYEPDFYSFDNGGFNEFDDRNEEGFMFGTKIKYNRDTKFWGYVDVFRRIWRSYDNSMPPYGFEAYGKIEHRIYKKLKYSVQYKIEEKEKSMNPFGTGSELYWVHNDWRLRNTFEWEPVKAVKFKIYYENAMTFIPSVNVRYNSDLILSDIRYQMTKRLKIYLRNVFFDTLSAAGIWEYENDLPEYMASNAFYGKGNRMYILISDKISKGMQFTLKLARTHFYNASDITTSLDSDSENTSSDTILGASKYDFRAQINYKF